MSRIISLAVEKDHVDSLTKANGITALSELIWNALDADASEIRIKYTKNGLNGYSEITISDNGHGLTYEKALQVFGSIGGSEKKLRKQSPNGRLYHGKEGKGRLKCLALGDLVEFTSCYEGRSGFSEFTIVLNRNHLSNADFSDLKKLPKSSNKESGFCISIRNVDDKRASEAFDDSNRIELEQKFSSYFVSHPDFSIWINERKLDFESLIKNSYCEEITLIIDEEDYVFAIKIVEWNFQFDKKRTYLCYKNGIPFNEINLGIRSSLPISIFIQSDYIEKLHRENKLDIEGLDPNIIIIHEEAKKIAREYVKRQLHMFSVEFIANLKKEGLYPYSEQAEGIVEESKRQVFDIVALQINEFLPQFEGQDKKSKKLTLSLVKQALEKDADSLRRILEEVIELPEDKRDELVEILEESSLSDIIDSMTEIKNRLHFIRALEEIIYNDEVGAEVQERKHLHKFLIHETWLFGDNYTYGADDISLKNVLKTYLKDVMKREDFAEIVDSADNSELGKIPDVCLWSQYSMGSSGKENLVIELKKPNKLAGFEEKSQIESYASRVINDPRFPKENTNWKFILLVKDIKPEIASSINQKGRSKGHIIEGENYDVFILTWGDVLTEAKIRHEFIKEKLNLNLSDNEKGLQYLRTKYKEYLPESF
jgi:hypothetical protein